MLRTVGDNLQGEHKMQEGTRRVNDHDKMIFLHTSV